MKTWELYVGSRYHRYYIRATEAQMKTAMYAYIRDRRKQGISLSNILFVYGPVQFTTLTEIKHEHNFR